MFSAPHSASEKPLGEPGQDWQRAAVATEHDTDSQQHAARLWRDSRVEGLLPLPANFGQFVFAIGRFLIAHPIAAVSVKSNRARLHPHPRLMHDVIQCSRNRVNGIHAGLDDFQNVFRIVWAIDIAPGEIHQRVRTIQMLDPFTDVSAGPFRFADAIAALAR